MIAVKRNFSFKSCSTHSKLMVRSLFGSSGCHFVNNNGTNGTRGVQSQPALDDSYFEDAMRPENIESCIETLKSMKVPSFGRKTKSDASKNNYAVLIPFCRNEYNEPSLLVTLRSSNLTTHKSQISFPGGQQDPEDSSDPIKTALRETKEEIGIHEDRVTVYGSLNRLPTRNYDGFIYPVVGYVDVDFSSPDGLKLNKSEVEKVLLVRLKDLCQSDNWRYTRWTHGLALPVYRDKIFNDIQIPRIWGITAIMIHLVMSALLPEKHTFSYDIFCPNIR